MPALYQAFGLNILSDPELPELLPGHPDKEIDLMIQYGNVPERLPNAIEIDLCSQFHGNCFQLNIEGTARYQAVSGQRIIVHPVTHAAATDIRLYLLGTVFGAILHQRNSIPLHASAIIVNGKAVAFTGDSGAGKSTIAAHFHQRGYNIISDDMIAMLPDLSGTTMVYGGYPRIKLWGDAVEHLTLDKNSLTADHYRMNKYHFPIPGAYQHNPVPLKGVYLLDKASGSTLEGISQLKGMQAIKAIIENTYRPHFVASLSSSKQHFLVCASIVQTTKTYRLTRPWGVHHIESWLDKLERHWLSDK